VVLVLDEPARRGPDDGRAVGRLGKAAAGAAYPGGETGLTADQEQSGGLRRQIHVAVVFSEEAAAEKYMPQLQHNMWVVTPD
jgi:hypothetical protein